MFTLFSAESWGASKIPLENSVFAIASDAPRSNISFALFLDIMVTDGA